MTIDTTLGIDTITNTELGCRPDCLYIHGSCRCQHREHVSRNVELPACNDLAVPF
jgi:hypothetical protein